MWTPAPPCSTRVIPIELSVFLKPFDAGMMRAVENPRAAAKRV